MKTIFAFIALTISGHSFSAPTILEFDEATEMKCHGEAQKLKCITQMGEENSQCLESNKTKLSQDCQKMHEIKMTNK
jgi:hypothetical protein